MGLGSYDLLGLKWVQASPSGIRVYVNSELSLRWPNTCRPTSANCYSKLVVSQARTPWALFEPIYMIYSTNSAPQSQNPLIKNHPVKYSNRLDQSQLVACRNVNPCMMSFKLINFNWLSNSNFLAFKIHKVLVYILTYTLSK